MSLIQQALKRKLQEDMGGGAVTSSEPPPLPESDVVEPKKSQWVKLFILCVVVVGLGGLAIGLFYYAARSWSGKTVLQSGSLIHENAPEKHVAAPESLKGKLDKAVASAEAEAAEQEHMINTIDANSHAALPVQQPVALAVQPPSVVPVVQSKEQDQVPVSSSQPPTPPAVAQAVVIPDSRWPILTLNGLLASERKERGAAIINNRLVNVNDLIEGVRLIEVKDQGVTLEFKGEQKFVLMGQMTR